MKKPILVCLLLGTASLSRAQGIIAPLVGLGVRSAAGGGSHRPHQQKETLFVVPASFEGHAIPQKRTPAAKLPRPDKGGTEVRALEELLAGRYAALQADSTALLISPELDKQFGSLRTNLEAYNPGWNTDPYSQEMSFYRQHDDIRRRMARSAK